MAGDLQTMINRIASELARADLSTTQIPNAINDAISIYAQERFYFSEVPASGTDTFAATNAALTKGQSQVYRCYCGGRWNIGG